VNNKHKQKLLELTSAPSIKQNQTAAKNIPSGENTTASTATTSDKTKTTNQEDSKDNQKTKPVKLNALYIRNNLYK